jgi:hypothetical protein
LFAETRTVPSFEPVTSRIQFRITDQLETACTLRTQQRSSRIGIRTKDL